MITEIVSGGQTGVDTLALICAKNNDIATSGWCPYNFMTEKGEKKDFLTSFNLKPFKYDSSIYKERTKQNIIDSDATLIFYKDSPGTKLTVKYCKDLNKFYYIVKMSNINLDSINKLYSWIMNNKIKKLNIAGSRESKLSKVEQVAIYNYINTFINYSKISSLF